MCKDESWKMSRSDRSWTLRPTRKNIWLTIKIWPCGIFSSAAETERQIKGWEGWFRHKVFNSFATWSVSKSFIWQNYPPPWRKSKINPEHIHGIGHLMSLLVCWLHRLGFWEGRARVSKYFPDGARCWEKKEVANRNRMERAVANKFMTFYYLPCWASKNHRWLRDVGLAECWEKAARRIRCYKFVQGEFDRGRGTSKGHCGSPQLLRRSKVPQAETWYRFVRLIKHSYDVQREYRPSEAVTRCGKRWVARLAALHVIIAPLILLFFRLCFHHSGTAARPPAAQPLTQPFKTLLPHICCQPSHWKRLLRRNINSNDWHRCERCTGREALCATSTYLEGRDCVRFSDFWVGGKE